MSKKPPKVPPPPNAPTTADAIGTSPLGVNRRFTLPGVFTSPQGLAAQTSGRRSLIGGST